MLARVDHKELNMAREKTARAQLKNTFQIIANLQNVLGLDISYENKVPPIGAPKAALTPAEVPAAIKCLLFTSFLIISKCLIGRAAV